MDLTLKKMTHDDNFIYLTFSLLLLLLGTALAQQFFDDSVPRLVQSALIVTLLVAVWGVDSKDFVLRKTYIFPVAILFTKVQLLITNCLPIVVTAIAPPLLPELLLKRDPETVNVPVLPAKIAPPLAEDVLFSKTQSVIVKSEACVKLKTAPCKVVVTF